MSTLRLSLLFLTLTFSLFGVSKVEFLKASLHGDYEMAERLIREEGSALLKMRDKDENTPLHLAAHGKKTTARGKLVSLYLQHGANPNARNRYRSTPLHIAVSSGNIEATEALIRYPSTNPNVTAQQHYTPLHFAVLSRHIEIIKILLSSPKLNPNVGSTEGMTPLHHAAEKGLFAEASLLAGDSRTDTEAQLGSSNFPGGTPLHLASLQGHLPIVKLLLSQDRVDVNAKVSEGLYEGYTPLHFCAINPESVYIFDVIKLLLGAGANPKLKNRYGKRPHELTDVLVIKTLLIDPNGKYELKQNSKR